MDKVIKAEREYYSPARIAHESDMSRSMVSKLIREGVLDAVKFRGRLVRVTAESYERFKAGGIKVA